MKLVRRVSKRRKVGSTVNSNFLENPDVSLGFNLGGVYLLGGPDQLLALVGQDSVVLL